MRHSIKWLAAALIAVAGFAFTSSSAMAGDPGQCAAYAAQAVQQFNKNVNGGCGFGGPRWSADYGGHFAWCLIADTASANSETQTRKNMLNQCSTPQPVAGKTFKNPKIGGVRLDWCRKWAKQCGGPAANQFCQDKGYDSAANWKKANNIGYTRVISSAQICDQPTCDGFKRIRCTN